MEAPAILKVMEILFHRFRLYGMAPDTAVLLWLSLSGDPDRDRNPCTGPDAELTFHSQSTYVLPVQGKEEAFIFMADRWNPENAIDGRYVWLPINFVNDKLIINGWMNGIFHISMSHIKAPALRHRGCRGKTICDGRT